MTDELPPPDGTAMADVNPHPSGGYEYREVDAWSEPLVRAAIAAAVARERERCAQLAEDMDFGFGEIARAIRRG